MLLTLPRADVCTTSYYWQGFETLLAVIKDTMQCEHDADRVLHFAHMYMELYPPPYMAQLVASIEDRLMGNAVLSLERTLASPRSKQGMHGIFSVQSMAERRH